jgi:hypothetical protein
MTWWRADKSFPIRIFLAALILRLIPVLSMRNMGIGLDDMFQYDMLARSIVAGNGYRWYAQEDLPLIQPFIQLDLSGTNYDPRGVPTSFRPPLYPTILALVYLASGVGGGRFFIARLVQTVLAASLAPLTYALARRFFKERPRLAIVAAWIVTLYPLLVIYPLSLATENLFFLLFLATSLALLKAADSVREDEKVDSTAARPPGNIFRGLLRSICESRWFILTGILLGLTSLTRSVALGMAGLTVGWIWFGLRLKEKAILVTVLLALVTVPWMVRNTLLNRRLTGVESALGYDLYVGYHPNGSGTFQYPQSLDLLPMLDDGQRDAVGREKAIEFIQADPGRFPYLILRRAGYFLGLERRAFTYFYSNDYLGYIPTSLLLLIAAILCLPFTLVAASAVLGLAVVKWRKEIVLLGILMAGYMLPHLFIIAEDRFHLALVPFLAILAAYSWSGGWNAIRARWQTRSGKIVLGIAAVAILLMCLNWTLELWRDADKLALLLGPHGNQTYSSY